MEVLQFLSSFALAMALDDYLGIGVISTVVGAMWAGLVWFVKQTVAQSISREEKLRGLITEHQKFEQGQLMIVIEGNQKIMAMHAEALNANTRVTNELKHEIHALRMEAKGRHNEGKRKSAAPPRNPDDSGIT